MIAGNKLGKPKLWSISDRTSAVGALQQDLLKIAASVEACQGYIDKSMMAMYLWGIGYTYKEVAEMLQLTRKKVRYIVTRAGCMCRESNIDTTPLFNRRSVIRQRQAINGR